MKFGRKRLFDENQAIPYSDMALELRLPKRNAQQNFFDYHFGFLMKPKKKKHPRTKYRFQRLLLKSTNKEIAT